MFIRSLAVTLAAASFSFAATTQPATQPKKFPTPAELAEKIKAIAAKQDAMADVAEIDLSGQIAEQPNSFSLFGGEQDNLQSLVGRIDKARKDPKIEAVLMILAADVDMNLSQAEELRDALARLRDAKKKSFVYADSYDTATYVMASGATDICMLRGGEIMLPGIGLQTMFYRGAFDKLGVQADYVQIGEYKGAQEPYTRTGASDELRGEFKHLSSAMYDELIDGISQHRDLSKDAVKRFIDESIVDGAEAKQLKLVDRLLDQDGLQRLLKRRLKNDIDLIKDYGERERPSIDFSNPFALLSSLAKKPAESEKPAVAVIYAHGVITDGDGNGSFFGESGVGSEAMRKAFRIAERDEHIKAVVLRIDSPGGSALASEVMWQAARRLTREAHKPLIISVGSMAASGGYYLASAGDTIFADPHAIVGSIGVVGGKLVLKDLFAKLGLSTESFVQGANADLFSQEAEWTDSQRELVHKWMQKTYEQFTKRVMTTRKGKIKDIDQVARGRVFLAGQAKELGMIDEIGGCSDAIEFAARQAKLQPDSYEIRSLPAPKTLADYIGGSGEPQARLPLASPLAELLTGLAPSAREQLLQQFQVLQLLQRRPVMLTCPVIVTSH